MATLITPSVIAGSALATLYNMTVLLPLVSRDYQGDFQGKQGETISVRTPAQFSVKEFDPETGIELQQAVEGSFTVDLDLLLDVSVPITAKELTLELNSFERQILDPIAEAFSQDIDARLAEQLIAAASAVGGGGVAQGLGQSGGDRIKALRRAKTKLTRAKLPNPDRNYVVSPEGAEALTTDPTLLQANTSGSTEALREGAVGRLSGMNGYESQVFGAEDEEGERASADGVAFHRSAVCAVTRTIEAPEGVAASQVSIKSYKGLGLRVVKGYDQKFKQDVTSVDLLFGAQTIRKTAAVELDFGQPEGS